MRVRTMSLVAATAAVLSAVIALAGPASASPAGSPSSVRSRLSGAVVPAYCDMPRQRLHHNKTAAKYHPAEGSIVFATPGLAGPLKTHLRRSGTQVLAQYSCTAGGVGWPTVLVLYDRQTRLIASLRLARYAPHAEHSQVSSWKVVGHTVRVRWVSYQGAGFKVHHHRSVLRLRAGKLRFT